MMVALIVVGAAGGRLIRLPGAGLLGPMALTVVLQLTGLSFGLAVPAGAGAGRLHADRLAGGRRVHPGLAARGRTRCCPRRSA